ncbi:MAG: hypothetical protein ACYDEV_00445 [Acidiferrobacter sp.]
MHTRAAIPGQQARLTLTLPHYEISLVYSCAARSKRDTEWAR